MPRIGDALGDPALSGRLLSRTVATKLLVYDGRCAYCRGFARLMRVLDRHRRFALLPFDSAPAQELLRAQFGEDFGFAMFLFEEDSVSWGRTAAQRIIQNLRLPGARVAFWLYPAIVSLVSRLTRRERTVCGPECFHQAHNDSVPLQASLKPEVRKILLSL